MDNFQGAFFSYKDFRQSLHHRTQSPKVWKGTELAGMRQTLEARPPVELKGAANIGVRPQFDPPKELLEPHFFDFSGDLYGQEIEVAFHHFLRPEAKFDSLEAIVNFAIEKEKEAVEFYSNLSKEEAFSGTKEMFADFAREEHKHTRALMDNFEGRRELYQLSDNIIHFFACFKD